MKRNMRSQKGAFLVILLIIVVALLGFAALSLDVGRVMILRAEMQNAVDAAALAAAKELDGQPGARERAVANARYALEHNSHFARVKEMIGVTTLPYISGNDSDKSTDTDAFTFFCVIGSDNDIDPDDVDVNHFCGSGTTQYDTVGRDKDKYVAPEALADEKSHYVRIRLHPDNAPDNFSLNLIFLPVIEFFGGVTALREVSLGAVALAGRNWFVCDYPPMVICNPFEPEAFDDKMNEGESIQLKGQSGSYSWTPGNFGFLTLYGSGASSLGEALADEGDIGCSPAIVTTKTGQNFGKAKSGINTRFGIYTNSDDYYDMGDYGGVSGNEFSDTESDGTKLYPPAPSVANYPPDNGPNTALGDPRFGNGEWNCAQAWEDNHGSLVGIPPALNTLCTSSSSNWTRWQMYNWELDTLLRPPAAKKPPPSTHPDPWVYILEDVFHDEDDSVRDRRRIFVAVLDCAAHGLNGGKSTAPLFGNDGFAEIFITRTATPGGSDPLDGSIFGEYLGWGSEDDDFIHVEVKLFE